MIESFKKGQIVSECEDYPMRIWIEQELNDAIFVQIAKRGEE